MSATRWLSDAVATFNSGGRHASNEPSNFLTRVNETRNSHEHEHTTRLASFGKVAQRLGSCSHVVGSSVGPKHAATTNEATRARSAARTTIDVITGERNVNRALCR